MVERPEQVPFDLGGEPSYTRDDLVVSQANAAAVALVDSWPEWPTPWAILIGEQGCGKTHLAEIWRGKSGAKLFMQSQMNDAADFARTGGNIVIDGLSPDDLDEHGLFHLMNTVRQHDSSLLMTALKSPEHFDIKTPDLKSRLKAAMTANIREPDDALIAAVIIKLFADRQINVDPAIVDYMLLRADRSLKTINSLVDQIDRAALAAKSKVTKPLVRGILEADNAA